MRRPNGTREIARSGGRASDSSSLGKLKKACGVLAGCDRDNAEIGFRGVRGYITLEDAPAVTIADL